MKTFIQQQGDRVWGVLSGFDRVRFRGTLRWLVNVAGLGRFLNHRGVLLKEFDRFVMGVQNRIRASIESVATRAGKKTIY